MRLDETDSKHDAELPELADKAALAQALRDAAELEHQLMLGYLYTGFSLKRGPDARCTPAQYEAVRRWSSTLFMIARQEMEHLSLANGMLTAIGEPDHFARKNIGKGGFLSPYLAGEPLGQAPAAGALRPVLLPYGFTRFDIDTIDRFVCGESPPLKGFRPPSRPPAWCFTSDPALLSAGPGVEVGDPWLPTPNEDVGAGTVEQLYERIRSAFVRLPDLFVGSPPEVVIPVEYNVFVFPVTDQRSALGAIDIILEQGEGLKDPWNLDSHFRRFSEIRLELIALQAADPDFDPAYPLLRNPQRGEIENSFTGEVFDVANQAYTTLLLILAGLYQRATAPGTETYPYLSTALRETAFAPAMTMIIRALNEVLVRLPIGDGRPIDDLEAPRTGCNFEIGKGDLQLLLHPRDHRLGDIDFLRDRWEAMTAAIRLAAEHASADPWSAEVAGELRYVFESSHRVGANLGATYEFGEYPKYIEI